MKLYTKRLLTRFPLKDNVVGLDQDQSGLQKKVTTKGRVLKLTVFGTPTGTDLCVEKGRFNNQYARCGASFMSILQTLLRPPD